MPLHTRNLFVLFEPFAISSCEICLTDEITVICETKSMIPAPLTAGSMKRDSFQPLITSIFQMMSVSQAIT